MPSVDTSGDGWPEWGNYVLKELERLNLQYEKILAKLEVVAQRRIDDAEIIRLATEKSNKRIESLERFKWALVGILSFLSPVFIWAIIQGVSAVARLLFP